MRIFNIAIILSIAFILLGCGSMSSQSKQNNYYYNSDFGTIGNFKYKYNSDFGATENVGYIKPKKLDPDELMKGVKISPYP